MNLVFLDLETTHLDPGKGGIIEIGVIMKPKPGVVFATHALYVQPAAGEIWDPFCVEMHSKNGLYDDIVVEKRGFSYEEADERLFSIIAQNYGEGPLDKENRPRLAGFSVQFDLEWLKAKGFKKSLSLLSHRIVDCSTLRDVGKELGWEFDKGEENHRAIEDCFMAINCYNAFKEEFGKRGGSFGQ